MAGEVTNQAVAGTFGLPYQPEIRHLRFGNLNAHRTGGWCIIRLAACGQRARRAPSQPFAVFQS